MTPVRLGLVVPCYNEQDALPEAMARLCAMLDQLQASGVVSPESSITFVDDGSSDATWRLIEAGKARDPRVSGIKLTTNQGHQNALLAGLLNAAGDVLVSLDAGSSR
jgi:glycosyltransferase involved in cell wall biosynthesis